MQNKIPNFIRSLSKPRSIRKSTQIMYFLVLFIFGIAIETNFDVHLDVLFLIVLVFVLFALYLKKKLFLQYTMLLLGTVFLLLGVIRVAVHQASFLTSPIYDLYNQTATFEGKIVFEPDERENGTRYVIETEKFKERILIFGPVFPRYSYQDKISFRCFLEQPEFFEGFDYPGYLAKDDIYALCYDPTEIVLIEDAPQTTHGWFLQKRIQYQDTIMSFVGYPEFAFVNSILLGARSQVPEKIQQQFRITGTSHIMAISGLHIAILSYIVFALCRNIFLPKKHALWVLIIFLVFFLLMIGFKASALRAGLFGLVGVLAFWGGRPKQSALVLLWAAVVLLLYNPLLLVHDIGFQLSFLAVFSILYTGPLLRKWFAFMPELFGIKDLLIMTISAQIFIVPWVLLKFDTISIISIVVNVIILPLIPMVMLLSIMILFFGHFLSTFADILGFMVTYLVQLVLFIVSLFAQLPFASKTLSVGWSEILIMYALLGILFSGNFQKWLSIKIFRKKKKMILKNDYSEPTTTEIIDLKKYSL